MNDNENTGQELAQRIGRLKNSMKSLQEYKGEIVKNLKSILREIKILRHKQTDRAEGKEVITAFLNSIEKKAVRIEELCTASGSTEEVEAGDAAYYKVNLKRVLNFGILDIESEDTVLQVVFKGCLFEIINELITKYIEDSKTSCPIEFRGYVSRKMLEKKLYGKYVGRNRLNSHITRIRTMLTENGMADSLFIKSLEEYIRMNVNSNDVTVTDIKTD